MHEGHRRRMYDKLISGDTLFEHERLEMLLFNAFPRKNTNPLAHKLLQTFGSISGVLNASVEELTAVDGVGESVALYLCCIGACVGSAASKKTKNVCLNNYADFKNFVAMRMRGKTVEVIEIYCLEKNGTVKNIFPFTSNGVHEVNVSTDKIARIFSSSKPNGILVAHNHLSGISQPSQNDDNFTRDLQLLCSMNNVLLLDHCIYASDDDIYSYFTEGKIDEIANKYSYRNLVDGQIKIEKS